MSKSNIDGESTTDKTRKVVLRILTRYYTVKQRFVKAAGWYLSEIQLININILLRRVTLEML